ncbi:hypothetical protein Q8W71_07370 [Methylobacterium sp. NEAU 140]|uniref:hypothetical protein n=1 Tax=Methylobacterium sp. NEAU 140 TaxID=3064945 RepID=UPI002733CA71|nr:hypothetical protein [Methylobacterium sp. NEAU 140]MDP4022437.1 hypothetical protein [Methylobacterium sp. NEAU 140]
MSAPANRRGFLRGLTTLPLVGGGVTLIGQPSAVAEPITGQLMTNYLAFLAREFKNTMIENVERCAAHEVLTAGMHLGPEYISGAVAKAELSLRYLDFPFLERQGNPAVAGPPSSRAALVLSAVGCDWKDGDR